MIADELDALEMPLQPAPLFYVEEPGEKPAERKKWPEHYRQSAFVAYLAKHNPDVIVFSIANERRVSVQRGQMLKRTGLLPGMPDVGIVWDGGWAFCEFKGWDAKGRPGALSVAQIETCNRLCAKGVPVACFFSAATALAWLRERGMPVARWAA